MLAPNFLNMVIAFVVSQQVLHNNIVYLHLIRYDVVSASGSIGPDVPCSQPPQFAEYCVLSLTSCLTLSAQLFLLAQ
jgi:hypothetical protein